jgi:hypothetical protein
MKQLVLVEHLKAPVDLPTGGKLEMRIVSHDVVTQMAVSKTTLTVLGMLESRGSQTPIESFFKKAKIDKRADIDDDDDD